MRSSILFRNTCRSRFGFALAALFVALAFGTEAKAAPITTLTIVYGNSANPTPQTLDLFNGGVGQATPPQPAAIDAAGSIALGAYSVTGITLNTVPYSGNPGTVLVIPTTLTVTGTALSGPGQDGSDLGKTATFSFVTGTLQVTEGGAADAVSGQVQLTGNSGILGIDFGPIGTIFNFNGSLQGTTFTPGTPTPGSVSGAPNSSSFTLTVTQQIVPEPASLLIWGCVGVCGVWVARRRRLFAS